MTDSGAIAGLATELQQLGQAMMNKGRLREAAVIFSKAMALEPGKVELLLWLGHCLHQRGDYEAASQLYDNNILAFPMSAALWNNRGNTLLEMGRFDEALPSYARAVELEPGMHDARVAMASCYQALGRYEHALKICEAVIAEVPEHAEAHWNRALLLLLSGNYPEGWREYEWRWKKREFTSPRREFSQPQWRGEPASGKVLLVHAEQGFGDTIQFCRYIPLLSAMGIQIIFECHPQLVPLMRTLKGCPAVVPMGQSLPGFDLHVPLLSLPGILSTTITTIPADMPYLYACKDLSVVWSGLTRGNRELKVGICWSGKRYPDPGRSCPADALAPLVAIEGISWHSLQKERHEDLPFPMSDSTDIIDSFADTAALIAQLDLVISIDTAVAHLAGAMGKPVWVMLPYAPDWRWLLVRDDSPWYPSARLFRQNGHGTWAVLLETVAAELRNHTQAGHFCAE